MVSKTSVSLARAMSAASGGECDPQGFKKPSQRPLKTTSVLSACDGALDELRAIVV